MIRPPRLAPGARVALVTPAGPVTDDRIDTAVERCRALDLVPAPGSSVRRRDGYLAGPDADRARDLQAAVDDDGIHAIWAIRGGYGAMRILRSVDLSALVRRPKPFIGFSDNTAIHQALARIGVVSFHGPHAGYATVPPGVDDCFRRVLFQARPAGRLPRLSGPEPTTLRSGRAEGALVGGNLALLASLSGTPFAVRGGGRILLVEDVGEPVYRIDRMLTQLALSGTLDGLAGIAFGRFTGVPSSKDGDRPLETVLREWAERFDVPAVARLPFGHSDHNWTLPLGVRARLDADAGTLDILEPAVV